MKFIYKFKNNESGSVTIFVLTCLLTILMICSVYYVGVKNKETTQYKQIESIQQEYSQKDNADMDSEYDKVIAKSKKQEENNQDVINKGETATGGNKKYVDGDKIAIIPEGFKVSDKDGEGNIDKGLVVIGPDNSEFVWVPVPEAIYDSSKTINQSYTPLAELLSGSTNNYQGMLYEYNGSTIKYQSGYKLGTTSYREPAYLSGVDDNNKINLTAESLQSEYNAMVTSVAKYGGFYVGRYELGLEGTKTVSKNASTNSGVVTATAANSNTNSWYGLYKACKAYEATSTTSSMIWGSQWDAMLNWMAKEGIKVDEADTTNYNQTQITGKSSTDKINNIYDLYGCEYESTIEANESNIRVGRGGAYSNSLAPSYRGGSNPTDAFKWGGTRITLYIN